MRLALLSLSARSLSGKHALDNIHPPIVFRVSGLFIVHDLV